MKPAATAGFPLPVPSTLSQSMLDPVMGRRGALRMAAVLALAIAGFSLLPTEDKFALHTQGNLHPWLHVGAFAVLAVLLMLGVRSGLVRIIVFLALLALGWGTEFIEHLRDGWPVEGGDVLLDAAGVVLGSMLGSVLSSLLALRPRQS